MSALYTNPGSVATSASTTNDAPNPIQLQNNESDDSASVASDASLDTESNVASNNKSTNSNTNEEIGTKVTYNVLSVKSLKEEIQSDSHYIFKYPIVLVKDDTLFKSEPFVTVDKLTLDNIIAFNGFGINNLIYDHLVNKNVDSAISKLVFYSSGVGAGMHLPLQNLFFVFFAQMVFLSNLQEDESKKIDIHNDSFSTQYNKIKIELENGIQQRKMFGTEKGEFNSRAQSINEKEEDTWWDEIRVNSFTIIEDRNVSFDKFIEIFLLGPSAMYNLMLKEKKIFEKISPDDKKKFKQMMKLYAEAKAVEPAYNASSVAAQSATSNNESDDHENDDTSAITFIGSVERYKNVDELIADLTKELQTKIDLDIGDSETDEEEPATPAPAPDPVTPAPAPVTPAAPAPAPVTPAAPAPAPVTPAAPAPAPVTPVTPAPALVTPAASASAPVPIDVTVVPANTVARPTNAQIAAARSEGNNLLECASGGKRFTRKKRNANRD